MNEDHNSRIVSKDHNPKEKSETKIVMNLRQAASEKEVNSRSFLDPLQ